MTVSDEYNLLNRCGSIMRLQKNYRCMGPSVKASALRVSLHTVCSVQVHSMTRPLMKKIVYSKFNVR